MKTLKLAFAAAMLISLTAGKTEATTLQNSHNLVLLDGITANQVCAYLMGTFPPHTIITMPTTEDGGFTWHCVTKVRGVYFNTVVYTDGTNIVFFEDTAID